MSEKWPVARLGGVVDSLDYGHTASATEMFAGPKFLRITDIQNGSVDWHSVPYCECNSDDEQRKALRPGDIVFARTGATTGKSFLISTCPSRAVFASYLIRIRPSGKALPSYLYHFFQTPAYWQQIALQAHGAAQAGVNASTLKEILIPLPPLPEQRRIAAILDQADALRTKRRQALARLDTLTQSIFLEMFGDPTTRSTRWDTVQLGELGKWQSGGTPPRSEPRYFGGTIPWFSSGELGDMCLANSCERVSLAALSETSAKAVSSGALLLGMYDTAALKASIASVDCSCNQAVAFATIDAAQVKTVFVYWAIRIGRHHFRRLQRGVRQKNLNLSMIREISIPHPPLSLQACFCDRMAQVAALMSSYRASLARLDSLFASLQYRAFRGEL